MKARVRVLFLDRRRDRRHRAHRFERVIAARGFAAEHNRIGAVEDRVGDVGRFGARRARTRRHRLEHLRRGDDRFGRAVGPRDQVLLDQRDVFEPHFDAEVAPRDHDAVGGEHDRIDVLERFVLLDLGHDGNALPAFVHERAHAFDVGRGADERNADPIDAGLETEREVFEIAIGHRVERERAVGIVDPLHRPQRAAGFDPRMHFVAVDRLDAQRDRAVGQVDQLAGVDVAREPGIGDADAGGRPGHRFGRQRERCTVGEKDRRRAVGERSGADLRSRQVLQHGDVHAELGRDRAHVGDHRRVFFVRAVREVQPRDVHAGQEQLPKHFRIAG